MFKRKEEFSKEELSFEKCQGVTFKDDGEIYVAMLVNTNDKENSQKIIAVSAEGNLDKVYIYNASDYTGWDSYIGEDEYLIQIFKNNSLRLDITEL